MQSNASFPTSTDAAVGVRDLGPLAWVLDELRKSLDASAKALKRFVRDSEAARGADLASVDAGQLRIARQQLHQAVGALEMVGLAEPALLLRAMEAAVQRFLQQPEHCTQDAAAKIERASFALTEYLDGVLANKQVSAISLFPQYRDVRELVRADRIHPADLWTYQWRWLDVPVQGFCEPVSYSAETRKALDQFVLPLMRGRATDAAHDMCQLCAGIAAAQSESQPRVFWNIAAALFEALSLDILRTDVYVKRVVSRVLMQYTSLSKGNSAISERLVLDLLFFCAQSRPQPSQTAPRLAAVREVYGLSTVGPTDYETVQFGRFDPALLAQARKRITSAKEIWSSFSAGDLSKSKLVADQFSLVSDSLLKLHPQSEALAAALLRAIDTAISLGSTPRIELAMEVATSILYLEAAFEDLDPNDPQMTVRMTDLAERLEKVRVGGVPQPLQAWMEDLYRRVSDKQTMGSVVGELRTSLGELESSLDVFFRDPGNKTVLAAVPRQLAQMRGVLSVLGLDQASQAVLRMRDMIESMLLPEAVDQGTQQQAAFDQLGNNLGALSFLIDMLNYQPTLAKQLFVYDDEKGELRPLMGRVQKVSASNTAHVANPDPLSQEIRLLASDATQSSGADLTQRIDQLATDAALAGQAAMARSAKEISSVSSTQDAQQVSSALNELASNFAAPKAMPAPAQPEADFEEDDLQDIFLEEASEVLETGRQALAELASDPSNVAHLTVLRRAFHTLKGSARMVGLTEFGEAGWSMEQLLNSWLADQKSATDEFSQLCSEAMAAFSAWVSDISNKRDQVWSSVPFRQSADALRSDLPAIALVLPATQKSLSAQEAAGVEAPFAEYGALPSEVAAFQPVDEGSFVQVVVEPSFDEPSNPPEPEVSFDFELGDTVTVPAPQPGSLNTSTQTLVAEPPDLSTVSLVQSGSDLGIEALVETMAVRIEPDTDPRKGSVDDFLASPATGFNSEEFPTASASEPTANISMSAEEMSEADFDAHFSLESPVSTVSVTADSVAADFDLVAVSTEPGTSSFASSAPSTDNQGSDWSLAGRVGEAIAPAAETLKDITTSPDHNAFSVSDSSSEEQVKTIGSLRIGIPLYNVFLNEADEWSRRLAMEVAEWTLEPHLPIAESTVALAHSLAGSSATVGFHALSEMARALEYALEQSRAHHHPKVTDHSQVFTDASEDIRRLLHQFAAGFLKDPDAELLERLRKLEFMEPVLVAGEELSEGAGEGASETPPFDEPTPVASMLLMEPERGVTSSAAPHNFLALQGSASFDRNAFPTSARSFSSPATVDEDDDIDAVDAIDFELFPIFEEEAEELLPQLGGAMRQWSARPDNMSARMEVLRALHTLKGSARLAGALRLGEMAHRIESDIEYLGSEITDARELDPLLGRFDALQATFEKLRYPGVDDLFVPSAALESPAVTERLPADIVDGFEALPVEATADASNAVMTAEESQAPHDADAAGSDMPTSVPRRVDIPAPQTMALQALRQSSTASIRVRSQLLDRMVNQAGEVMITRSRLEAELSQLRSALGDMSGNLNRLRQQLRDIEVQAESQMQSRLAQAKESQASFDPLEFDRFTRVQELTRMMAESVNDVATVQRTLQRTVDATEDDLVAQARQTRELQRDLLRTRMVEFEGISDRLYRVVRQASKDTGKQVKLDLLGGTIEMDRGMLDRMTPAFEHLLRNCVAHGIESPEVRVAAGKDPVGLITVHLKHEGNDVSVDFSDDGQGLDLARIRDKALGLGLLQSHQVLTDQDAANLIFLPGFSTATQVTELAGRGIGMDVVRSEVNALGGRIETTTVAGQGSHFNLVLPLTTAVTQVVMIRAGALSVGVPANLVETVRRTSNADLQQAYQTGMLDVGGESVPFFWAGALLQASRQSTETQEKSSQVVIFRSAAQRVALHVDEVLGNREVVVKNLGPQLSRLPGLAGMSVLASGAVVLIYNPVALASVYGPQARSWGADAVKALADGDISNSNNTPALMEAPPQVPLILVVDDSITVRRVTQRLLQREGYRVVMAADGLQALERLQDELPAVVLSDIEMPRMDGFDLARNIRADARLAGLPIVMITSRIAEKHREHAMSLGVDHYLGKPYSEDELMSLVRHYCTAVAAISS